jgi:hypothetical protein
VSREARTCPCELAVLTIAVAIAVSKTHLRDSEKGSWTGEYFGIPRTGHLWRIKVIVCAGMWSASLLGEPFSTLLKVCRQKLFWFKLEEPSIFPEDSPSFIITHGPSEIDACYGVPPIPGEGSMKIATERYSGLSWRMSPVGRTSTLGHVTGPEFPLPTRRLRNDA